MSKSCINIPASILIIRRISIILIVSLIDVFFLINTRIPSPALEHRPAITYPKLIPPLT